MLRAPTRAAPIPIHAAPRRLLALAACLALGACGQSPPPSGSGTGAAQDEAARAAQLAERERAVAKREAAIAAREAQQGTQAAAAAEAEAKAKAEALAQAEKDKAAADAAAAQAARDQAAAEAKRVAAERAAADRKKAERERAARAEADRKRDEAKAKNAAAAAAARPIEVAAGTRLAVALKQALSSKTARPGERFEAVLTEDVTGTDGRVAVPAGATLVGSITHVVSGSREIGATPVIALRFDHLVAADGKQIPISGELDERGASERGRDTAKILGGAAAGAVIGNQSRNNDRGRLIGALVGGAIGAIAAKNTGTEVSLQDGAALTIALSQPFTVTPPAHAGR